MKARIARTFAALTAVSFLLVELAVPARAAACFQPADIEADQAVRYQTELMVLEDTCRVNVYRDFTVRNRDQIVAYQTELKQRFRRNGAKNVDASLDNFMTQVANELSLSQGQQLRADICSHAAPVIDEAKKIDAKQFRTLAAALATENRSSYKSCR